jgi:hypothetical protein
MFHFYPHTNAHGRYYGFVVVLEPLHPYLVSNIDHFLSKIIVSFSID